jgi:hypothetical protein
MSGLADWANSHQPPDPSSSLDPNPSNSDPNESLDRTSSPPVVEESSLPKSQPTLSEVLSTYDLIDVIDETLDGGKAIVVAPKQLADPSAKADLRELGYSSPSPFTGYLRSEYNAELRDRYGLRKYDEMRKSDGTVRGTLREVKTPILGARWFVEAKSENVRDQNAADFVWWNLQEAMSISFGQVIHECLLMLEFGYYMFEKVWIEDRWNNREVLRLKKLMPLHPIDVDHWEFDANGGPKRVWMDPPPDELGADLQDIDIEKLLVFSFDREAGNIQGISLLRSAYKHWYFKEMLYKIDAIQKERHGIGVPVVKLPPNFTPGDKDLAHAIGRNLRTNETAHVVLPPNWELIFAKLEGQPVDALKSAVHHDLQIQKNIMAPFLDKPVGADEMGTFHAACRFIADLIKDTFNKYLIPQLIGYNLERVGVPRLRATNIGSKVDLRTLSFALRNFVGAKLIEPDDRLETYLRDIADLPPKDPATVRREIATPQAPAGGRQTVVRPPGTPVAGMPRQSQAASMQQAQTAGSNGRVGRDTSGGS